jgi:hypothetical protein
MMPRNRLGYVNRSALIDKEQSMTASHLTRASAQSLQARQRATTCQPMSHQNSGDHGHEIYPQQFVQLVGCHDAPAPLRKAEDEQLH